MPDTTECALHSEADFALHNARTDVGLDYKGKRPDLGYWEYPAEPRDECSSRDVGKIMRVLLLGDFSANFDEGYKNASHYLACELERENSVIRLNIKRLTASEIWRHVGVSDPQIIHTIAQPTSASLAFTRLLRLRYPHARSVVSALRADRYFGSDGLTVNKRWELKMLRPDVVLVQERRTELLFKEAGCSVTYLPNGVDQERFKPATLEQKRRLRQECGFDLNSPIVLHVGHLQAERNLGALAALPGLGIQVVIAGSLSMGIDEVLIQQLKSNGFHVLLGYQPHIEDFYRLSDCYVFPLEPGNSLTMPLSVLEAMACNLPVITTRFLGLQEAFREGDGFRFLDDVSAVPTYVHSALENVADCHTREMVGAYSWQAVVSRLLEIYEGLLNA